MKYLIPILLVLSLSACSSTKPQKVEVKDNLVGPKVSGFKDVEYMSRYEVIQASKDCINARMKPVVQYIPQKTQFGTLMLPAVVSCDTPYTINR